MFLRQVLLANFTPASAVSQQAPGILLSSCPALHTHPLQGHSMWSGSSVLLGYWDVTVNVLCLAT